MGSVLLYPANCINYVRFSLLLISFYNLKKRPVLAFVTGILAGLIDDFDGEIARRYNSTSKFGAAIDRLMDRWTTTVLYFFLTNVYPKYWYLFAHVGFVELFGDVLRFYKEVAKQELHIKLENNTIEDASISSYESILKVFLPLVWYTSDLFYWLLYFGFFIVNKAEVDVNNNLIFDENIGENRRKTSYTSSLKKDYLIIYDKLAKIFEASLMKLGFKFIDLKLAFNTLGIICLLGAFGKFYLNFQMVISCLKELIESDELYLNIKH